jgi:hypothetical protein
MQTSNLNQRWRSHRAFYRPSGELINTAEYEVSEVHEDKTPKEFIARHHCQKSYPAARFRYLLHRRGELVGVAVFSHPCNDLVLTTVFDCEATMSVELGRFVLLDTVPGNGESYFLSRCFTLLRRSDLVGVVSFSDPLPRRSLSGDLVQRGHVGTIYQAFSGIYLGQSAARTLRVLPDGSILNDRTIQKIRALDQGCEYASATLERFGATPLAGDPRAWLAQWLPRITRSLRHPGNHKYAWPLSRIARRKMPPSLPYPKLNPLFFAFERDGD